MSSRARRTCRTKTVGAAGVALAIGGVAAIVIGLCAQQSAPQPPASAAVPVPVTPSATESPAARTTEPQSLPVLSTPAQTTTASVPSSPTTTLRPTPTVTGPVLDRSAPIHLTIPAIDVSSDLSDIGLEPDGHITTPPLVKDSHAYWLNVSPTPGQLGPSVILGHVDSAAFGPAVFFDLGKLRQHDKIEVVRADKTVAVFDVTHVNEYEKAEFPTDAVYGNTDHAALRLMTCGGIFNEAERSYESNIVVYAALVASHRSNRAEQSPP